MPLRSRLYLWLLGRPKHNYTIDIALLVKSQVLVKFVETDERVTLFTQTEGNKTQVILINNFNVKSEAG